MAVSRIKSATPEITFSHSKMVEYKAMIGFNVGKMGVHDNLRVEKGESILYNGDTAEIRGTQYPCPALRGAVLKGWLSTTDTAPVSGSSGIKVSPTGAIKGEKFSEAVVNSEENVVHTFGDVGKMKVENTDSGEVVAELGSPEGKRTLINGDTDYSTKIPKIANTRQAVKHVKTAKPIDDDESGKIVSRIKSPSIKNTLVDDGVSEERSGNIETMIERVETPKVSSKQDKVKIDIKESEKAGKNRAKRLEALKKSEGK